MKKIILLSLVLLQLSLVSMARKGKVVVKKAHAASTQKTTKKIKVIPLLELFDIDGKPYVINKGDKLVYKVNANGQQYDFIVTINQHDDNGIDFGYSMTNTSKKWGSVHISSDAASNATNYINYFRGGPINLTNAISVWVSGSNFTDLMSHETNMSFDDGPLETFYKPDEAVVNPTINFKGKEIKLKGYKINNKENQTGDKTVWINNSFNNTLILKMDIGFTIELKEIK